MIIKLRYILLIPVFITIVGCVSAELTNISTEKIITPIENFKTIDATIYVRNIDPLSSANEDLAKFLERSSVFSSAIAIQSKNKLPENSIELQVVSEIKEEDFHPKEMAKAFLQGLLLSLADGAFSDEYEYTVAIKGIMKKGQKNIGTYQATSKYHMQQPTNKKTKSTSEVRKLVWEHVLKLMMVKIKEDRKNIMNKIK